MIGQLPQALKIRGVNYPIRTDFRNILKIIAAYNNENLSDSEKIFVCIRRLFKSPSKLPKDGRFYAEALEAANKFIECQLSNDRPGPTVFNWEKDEQLIFPAINKVAGVEVRTLEYLHWWTFLGYFQSIDRDDLWGTVLTIRQKKAKGKKLEKYEKEFLASNRDLCALESTGKRRTPEDKLREMYEEMLKEGGAENE
jgi:hypothetical protein